ncbi:MAG: NAD-dependent epimerase/dehydratase family protein [Phycisphaeraceae bacterium]|nr:MAG: NAD-dependent epimerase/dehydratase family protein [Phycisphaeraceae bacterium]
MKTHRHPRTRDASRGKRRPSPRYIVTGGAGFVGSNLCAALVKRDPGAEVIVVDDFSSGSYANLVEAFARAGVGPFTGTVVPFGVDGVELEPLIEGWPLRAVFHLAAITDTTVADEPAMIAANTTPLLPLMHACVEAGVPLVYASSAAVYGSPPQGAARKPFPVAAAGTPNNVYGFSKWLMECEHRRMLAIAPGAHVVGLRYFNVFGPGESRKGKMASMAYQLVARLREGKAPRLFKDGEQARDQVHVDDVVACTMAAAGLGDKADPAPGVYNVGSGVATSFNRVLAAVRKGLGIPAGRLEVEYFDMPQDVRAFYQDYTCADLAETAKGLGWKPAIDPQAGLTSYAAYLASRR